MHKMHFGFHGDILGDNIMSLSFQVSWHKIFQFGHMKLGFLSKTEGEH